MGIDTSIKLDHSVKSCRKMTSILEMKRQQHRSLASSKQSIFIKRWVKAKHLSLQVAFLCAVLCLPQQIWRKLSHNDHRICRCITAFFTAATQSYILTISASRNPAISHTRMD
ncbi:hypothetical protein AVEN_228681-1 [Araneus ventricosus]|uniref:Uncharacterized protein n=1 Tax=Araneus ventricosus TaxID=182803 RepID=A0A4Y2E117_ARAVE|nr:hypothetical protein AVEN_228681-1 [Araneus ventricosus]